MRNIVEAEEKMKEKGGMMKEILIAQTLFYPTIGG